MCNSACLEFAAEALTREMVEGKRVLEIGSFDVNGTVRPIVQALNPRSYLGVDIKWGPGVDEVCSVEEVVARYGEDRFEVVIATELVEHVRDWRLAITNMKRVLRPGGVLLITTRSRGFKIHGYPYDFWRYQPEDMRRIFADMELVVERDEGEPGVFVRAQKPVTWTAQPLEEIALFSVIVGRRVLDVSDWQRVSFASRYKPRWAFESAHNQVHQFYRALVPESMRLLVPKFVRRALRPRKT
jgi:SAM-dependent methyltransferase